MIGKEQILCAACAADTSDHIVVVVRTVIFERSPIKVSVCVPCDRAIPLSDLYWYPPEEGERS